MSFQYKPEQCSYTSVIGIAWGSQERIRKSGDTTLVLTSECILVAKSSSRCASPTSESLHRAAFGDRFFDNNNNREL